jgi:hypothetical protein
MPSVPVRVSCALGVSTHSRVKAVEQTRRMRGGSQSHLMRCSDDNYYVVKFQNNPQHRRILVNELLGTRLAEKMGLPTTPAIVVEVSKKLIDSRDDLVMELPKYRVPCTPGKQFGSKFFGNPANLRTLDLLPGEELPRVKNFTDFIGMVVFDKWTCNCDGRQCLFMLQESGDFSMIGIDQGFCFGQGDWDFPDSPLRGLYGNKTIYRELVKSMDDFEPWLSRVENELTLDTIVQAANGIPPEWYEFDHVAMSKLLAKLNARRKMVRELIRVSCARLPIIFPRWVDKPRPRMRAVRRKQLPSGENQISTRRALVSNLAG